MQKVGVTEEDAGDRVICCGSKGNSRKRKEINLFRCTLWHYTILNDGAYFGFALFCH